MHTSDDGGICMGAVLDFSKQVLTLGSCCTSLPRWVLAARIPKRNTWQKTAVDVDAILARNAADED